jgi:hypothetical protein
VSSEGSTGGGGGDGDSPDRDDETPKAVARISLKKKASKPPWATEPAREVPPDRLTPVGDPPADPEEA